MLNSFKPSGIEYPLAIRLSGKFKTAFPAGKPKPPEAEPNEKKEEASAPETMLKESKQETTVVLVGDSDMIQDRVAVRQVGSPFGQRLFMPANGNLAFAENLIDQLTGDSNLIAVRSRASRERPFTVVKKMQADAEASYRSKIKELEEAWPMRNVRSASCKAANRKGSVLSCRRSSRKSWRISARRKPRRKLSLKKCVRNCGPTSIRSRIESSGSTSPAMPALVALTGLVFAIVKRRRSAAR